MTYRSKRSSKEKPFPFIVLIGLVTAWTIILLAGILVTNLVDKNSITEGAITQCAVITVSSAALISSYLAGTLQNEKRFLIAVLNGAMFFLSLLGVNAIFYTGKYEGIVGNLLTIMGSSIIAGLLLNIQKKQRNGYATPSRKR